MPVPSYVWNGALLWKWWLLFGIVAAVLIWLLYRTERRLVSLPVGLVLVALRLCVVLLLFITLLEPTATWTQDRKTTGRILVAIDLSDSMGTSDPQALRAEKLRWARALGLVGNAGVNSRLDRWIEALENGKEPPWVDPHETIDPEKKAKLEQTRKENLDAVFVELDKLSRKEIALRLLTGTSNPLLPQLEKVGTVQISVFGGKQEAVDEKALGKVVNQTPKSLTPGATDVSLGLLSNVSDEKTRLIGAVVFTDGRDNAQHDPAGAARRLGAPVFPVILGSTTRPKDLSFRHLDFPETAFKNDKPILKGLLNTSGFTGEELEVSLEREGKEPIVKKVIAAGEETPLEFELDATELGRKEYTLKVPVKPGETRKDNNSIDFAMTVVDDKVQVLVIEGEARWEFRFIDACLRRDRRVELKDVVYQQPYMGIMPEGFFPKDLPLPPLENFDTSPLSQPDLIIVGDVSSENFPPRAWELLDRFVSESGGTLVLCAGKNSMPLGHNSPLLAQLLPVTDLKGGNVAGANPFGAPTERGFSLRLTPEGEQQSFLEFDVDAAQNRRLWNEFPGHTWGMFGEAKPGATVFAVAAVPGQNNPLEAERKAGIIVHQHYGLGQVLWIGIDSTWRWRHRAGDKYHHRFWGQIARWAASNKATVGNEFVKFGPEKSDFDEGEEVTIRARWVQQFLRRFPNLKATAEILRDNGKDEAPLATVLLKPSNRALIFEGKAGVLPAGEFKVRLKVEGADLGNKKPIEAGLYVHRPRSLELSELVANVDLLKQIGANSGGELILPDQTSRIAQRLKPPESKSALHEEVALWNHWLVMLCFFGLLTTEWVVRKLNGLP